MNVACTRQERNNSGASAVAAPLAQSTRIRRRERSVLTTPDNQLIYAARNPCSPGSDDGANESAGTPPFSESAKISCSMPSSCESGSLKPSPEKILIPLSVHGL